MITKIEKRDGSVVPFNLEKLHNWAREAKRTLTHIY